MYHSKKIRNNSKASHNIGRNFETYMDDLLKLIQREKQETLNLYSRMLEYLNQTKPSQLCVCVCVCVYIHTCTWTGGWI
jgi:hypothetical protein